MDDTTAPALFPTTRVNLLHAHGSPTHYLYRHHRCRCRLCREAQAQYQRTWCASHVEEKASYSRRHHEANRDRDLATMRDWGRRNKERKAAADRAYHASHRDEKAAYYRAWRSGHAEDKREQDRAYYAEHADAWAAYSRNRRAREHSAQGTHTAADVRAQYGRQHGKCFYCGMKAGDGFHVDHVTPLILGGSNGPENLVVTCPRCNLSKGPKHPADFAGLLL